MTSIWDLHRWLADTVGSRTAQSPAHLSGERGGHAAGMGFGTAAAVVEVSTARKRARELAMERPMVEHEAYMQTAIDIALARPAHPFAALLVDGSTGEVVAQGLNTTTANPLFHGEVVCINEAAKSFTRFDWKNTILYTTAEPCCMCQAAIMWCRIPHVVFGTSIKTLRLLGWNQFAMDSKDVVEATPFGECKIDGGVLRQRCDALFEVATEIRRGRQ